MHIHPTSGRIIVRSVTPTTAALVGVLTLPGTATIVEGACYQLTLCDRRIGMSGVPVLGRSAPEIESSGVMNLTDRHWPAAKVRGVFPVRCFAAFPESNTWIVYGPTNQPLTDDIRLDASGHACLDIQSGRFDGVPMPISAVGEAMQTLLSGHAIWPDAKGILHTMPPHHSEWRQHYHRLVQVLARYGRSDISLEAAQAEMRRDPALDLIRPYLIDPEYARYLALFEDAGGMEMDRPRTAAELVRNERLADQCVRQLMLAA